ncbi:MAG: lytic polysaccharide monooxygenase [Acidimicrobiia bacterium]
MPSTSPAGGTAAGHGKTMHPAAAGKPDGRDARSRRRRWRSRGGAAAALLSIAAGLTAVGVAVADAHGSVANPPSRAYQCRFLERDNPMCAQAWRDNAQALYDWMEVNIGDAAGRHEELIPDGQLCSAGRPKYAALDRPGDWPTTPLTRDADGLTHLEFEATAPHATAYYRWYLTKDGFDPAAPLRWADLELVHDSGPRPAEGHYHADVALPERQGHHILYLVWQRSDSPEAFYACSDVSFGEAAPTTSAPAPSTTTPAPPTTAAQSAGTTTPAPAPTEVTQPPTSSSTPTTSAPVTSAPVTTSTTTAPTTAPTTVTTTAPTTVTTTAGDTTPSSTSGSQSTPSSTSSTPTSTSSTPTSTSSTPSSTTTGAGAGAGRSWDQRRWDVVLRCRWWVHRFFVLRGGRRGLPVVTTAPPAGSATSTTAAPGPATTASTRPEPRPTTTQAPSSATSATQPTTTTTRPATTTTRPATTTTRPATTTTRATTTTGAPAPTTTAPLPPAGSALSEAEQYSLQYLNGERAEVGLPPLRAAADLSANARRWAETMRRSGFRHSSDAELRPFITGTRTSWGENIVWWSDPNATPQQAAARFNQLWVDSPGHYANMTSTRWTEVGVGLYHDSSGWWGVHQFSNGR